MLTCIFISTEVPRKWSFPTRVAGMFKQRHVFSCFWPVSNCQDTCWDWPVARVNWREKDLDRGIYLPRHHCPFEGCEWSGKDSGDQLKHIMSEHWTEDMQEAVRLLGAVEREAAVYSVLNAGISPPARWGLLDFMSVACSSPPLLSSSSCSTATLDAQCSLSDLNHDHPRPVFPAGPQPRPSPPSVPCRTSTTTIHAQCSLPDLNREYPRQVFPAGPHVGRYGTKNVQKKVRKNVRQVCYILLANCQVKQMIGIVSWAKVPWQKLQTKVVSTSCFEMSWWGSLEAK